MLWRTMKPSSRTAFWLILASFFVSGAAGLIYQVVWTRYLSLFLGHTSYAVVAVLIAFMGGLAIGNAWLGAKVDSLQRPLLFYAMLEFGIGLYAAVFPRYYDVLHGIYVGLVRQTEWTGNTLLTLKFLFACAAILPPTILMGATLPALTKYVTRSLAELRGKVAALYAINSTGAVVGTLMAD
jgi:spermidine synthase